MAIVDSRQVPKKIWEWVPDHGGRQQTGLRLKLRTWSWTLRT